MSGLALVGSELVFFALSLLLMQATLRWLKKPGLFSALIFGAIPAIVMAGYLFWQLQAASDSEVVEARAGWTQRAEQWSAERFPKPEQSALRDETQRLALGLFEVLPAMEFLFRLALLAALAVHLRRRATAQGLLAAPEKLGRWTAPIALIWVVLGPTFVLLGSSHGVLRLEASGRYLAWNILAVGLGIYLFQGLVVFGAKLSAWSKDPRTRALTPLVLAGTAASLLLLNGQGLFMFLILTGLFEPWIDLRRLSVKAEDGQAKP